MTDVQSFPPLLTQHAKALVLGSMPGTASLNANQYYAHGRNLFWPLMCDILGVPPIVAYPDKVALLEANHIAVWDVLARCDRPGSLDANIKHEIANDFAALFDMQTDLRHVFFNGKKAETSFRKLVWPTLSEPVRDRLILTSLPSTSPANAGYTYARKREAWVRIAEIVRDGE